MKRNSGRAGRKMHIQRQHIVAKLAQINPVKRWLGGLAFVSGIVLSGNVLADQLSELRWLSQSQSVFGISSDEKLSYDTEVLDNGYRLRVSFPGASLSKSIRDIGEVGIVRGVFPYETDDPSRANLDILLKTAGYLQVSIVDGGYKIVIHEGAIGLSEGDSLEELSQVQKETVTDSGQSNVPATAALALEDDSLSDLERKVLDEIAQSEAEQIAAASVSKDNLSDTSSESETADDAQAAASANRARITLQPSQNTPVEVEENVALDDGQIKLDEQPSAIVAAVENTAKTPISLSELDAQKVEEPETVMPLATVNTVQDQLIAQLVKDEVATAAGELLNNGTDGATNSVGAVLNSISYSSLPGGRVQVDFNATGLSEKPGIFRTNQPARIIVDFFYTKSAVMENIQRVGTGAVESIITAETDDRTRVILNLIGPVDFEQRAEENGVALIMSAPTSNQMAASRRSPEFESASKTETLPFQLTDVDFRRTEVGGGQIFVSLSSPEIGVDVREEAGEIIIDFPGTALPGNLEQRLDVIDFATPVQTIDTFFTGASSRMIVSPVGQYTYSSYQVGNELVVQVNPIEITENEREPDEFGYVGDKLTFNFQRITVRAALQVIADFTGLNFVTSDSVSGDLSLRLEDVPWDQALDTIMQVKGLAKRQRGNVVWVAPAEEIAAKERQALEAQTQVFELEPLVSELVQINYARANDISTILKSIKAVDTGVDTSLFGNVTVSEVETESNSLLSSRGNVTVDPRTNTILIQDTRSKIDEVRKLIAKLDRPVRQVLIETRIVEASDDFSRNIGARLGFSRLTENAQFPGSTGSNLGTTAGSASVANNASILTGGVSPGGDLSVDLSADGIGGLAASSYAFTLAKAGAGFAHLIDLEISALEAEGTGKVIANPRLLTTDQNEASIKQGQERVFTTSVLGEGGVVTKEAVLGLTVLPQITPDNKLVLEVNITKDSFSSADSTTINSKQIQTKVLLDNGETVVIGGIYEQTKSESTTKVPVLGDIPLLGALFRKKNKVDNRTELLIFLTPRIVDAALTVN